MGRGLRNGRNVPEARGVGAMLYVDHALQWSRAGPQPVSVRKPF